MNPQPRSASCRSLYAANIVVLTADSRTATATATCTQHREGSQSERHFTIRGRGTRVLALENGAFRIIHEHLSRFPSSP